MNSCFYGAALLQQDRWLRPQGVANQVDTPQVQLYGRELSGLTPQQLKYAQTERDRYEKPYKETKKKPKRTICTKPKPISYTYVDGLDGSIATRYVDQNLCTSLDSFACIPAVSLNPFTGTPKATGKKGRKRPPKR